MVYVYMMALIALQSTLHGTTRSIGSNAGEQEVTRALIQTAPPSVVFDQAVFAPASNGSLQSALYVVSNNSNALVLANTIQTSPPPLAPLPVFPSASLFTLVRASLGTIVTGGANQANPVNANVVALTPLVPVKPTAVVNGGTANYSPLLGNPITQITLFNGQFPVVAAQSIATPGTPPTGMAASTAVYEVLDTGVGNSILMNASAINDASGQNAIDGSIAALAANNSYIFAAVPAMGYDWSGVASSASINVVATAGPSGVDRGIAVLQPVAGTGLTVLNAYNFSQNGSNTQSTGGTTTQASAQAARLETRVIDESATTPYTANDTTAVVAAFNQIITAVVPPPTIGSTALTVTPAQLATVINGMLVTITTILDQMNTAITYPGSTPQSIVAAINISAASAAGQAVVSSSLQTTVSAGLQALATAVTTDPQIAVAFAGATNASVMAPVQTLISVMSTIYRSIQTLVTSGEIVTTIAAVANALIVAENQAALQVAFAPQAAIVNNNAADAQFGNAATMVWDNGLQRLYIGLNRAGRDDNNQVGGIIGVVMGRLQIAPTPNSAILSQLILQPVVSNVNNNLHTLFTVNNTSSIVGFYYDGVTPAVRGVGNGNGFDDVVVSANQICVLHTSTGKNYLIVQGGIEAPYGSSLEGVYALPLLSSRTADGLGIIPDAQVGTISQVGPDGPTFNGVPTSAAEMPHATDPRTQVGAGTVNGADVTNMFTAGDSVFFCMNGLTNQTAGIFYSTAIFDSNGAILTWTPLQRVMGSVQRVFGGGLATTTGNYYALTAQSNDSTQGDNFYINSNTVRISQWGTSDDTVNLPVQQSRQLSNVLTALFPQEQGGVAQIINFDQFTPGFYQGHFSMMAALGYGSVALIQTGADVNGQFTPTRLFTTQASIRPPLPQTVFFFNDDVLKNIGPLCTAAVGVDANVTNGWIFVGGYNGVAALTGPGGIGFNAAFGLDTLSGNGWAAQSVTKSDGSNFDHVRTLVAHNGVLYILTRDDVYTMPLIAGNFVAQPLDLGAKLPATAFNDCLVVDSPAGDTSYMILAASTGLYVMNVSSGAIATVDNSLPVIQLQYLSTRLDRLSAHGNCYALCGSLSQDPSRGIAKRFMVDTSESLLTDILSLVPVMPSAQPLFDFGHFRGSMFADGAFVYNARGQLFKEPTFVNMNSLQSGTQQITSMLDVGSGSNYNVGIPVRDSASGAIIIPGDWGVRVNE